MTDHKGKNYGEKVNKVLNDDNEKITTSDSLSFDTPGVTPKPPVNTEEDDENERKDQDNEQRK